MATMPAGRHHELVARMSDTVTLWRPTGPEEPALDLQPRPLRTQTLRDDPMLAAHQRSQRCVHGLATQLLLSPRARLLSSRESSAAGSAAAECRVSSWARRRPRAD